MAEQKDRPQGYGATLVVVSVQPTLITLRVSRLKVGDVIIWRRTARTANAKALS